MRALALPLAAASLAVCAPPCLADEPAASLRRAPVHVSWRSDGGDPIVTAVPLAAPGAPEARPLVDGLRRAPQPAESTLFSQYRKALEKESRRMVDRNPSLSWSEAVDEDGYPLRGADRQQRDARRLLGGAGNRLMSGWLERLVEVSSGMRAARGAVEGLRFDVRRGGGVGMGAGPARDSSEIATSLSVMVLGRPRLEMRSSLPWDLKARVEVPLDASGLRATLTRKFATGCRATFTMGSEDDERWVSAGVGVDF